MKEKHKEKYEQFKEDVQNLDSCLLANLYNHLDETDVDRNFMTECILNWTIDNEDMLDGAIEHLEELKKNADAEQ